MTTAQLSKVSLFVPRSDLDNTIKELSTFDWFHPEVDSVSNPDSNIDDLNSRLYTVFLELDELISLLDIELEPGVISILSKGFHVSPNNLNISSWSDLVETLESDSTPLISQLKDLNSEIIQTEKKLSDDLLLSNTLSSLSKMSFDLILILFPLSFFAILTTSLSISYPEIFASVVLFKKFISLPNPQPRSTTLLIFFLLINCEIL